jgi:hypothetical protein
MDKGLLATTVSIHCQCCNFLLRFLHLTEGKSP